MLNFEREKIKGRININAMILAWQKVKGKQLNISELKVGIKPIC